jgi:hypothetical protein
MEEAGGANDPVAGGGLRSSSRWEADLAHGAFHLRLPRPDRRTVTAQKQTALQRLDNSIHRRLRPVIITHEFLDAVPGIRVVIMTPLPIIEEVTILLTDILLHLPAETYSHWVPLVHQTFCSITTPHGSQVALVEETTVQPASPQNKCLKIEELAIQQGATPPNPALVIRPYQIV